VFTDTLPKARLPVLRVSVGFATSTSMSAVSETLPALAVSVTSCDAVTAEAAAWNCALVAPASTVTEAGTVRTALLLERLMVMPPLAAAALKLTEQESDVSSRIELLLQVRELSTGPAAARPVPVRLTTVVGSDVALLVTVSWPVALPDAVGLKTTLTFKVPPPPATVNGKLP
jgi:hypothetical protein